MVTNADELLWSSSETGDLDTIQQLISSGVNVNASNPNDEGWTALHYAAHEG